MLLCLKSLPVSVVAHSLDPDQAQHNARHNARPDLDCIFEKLILKKKAVEKKKREKFPSTKRV